jgi:hypothetical protein
VETTQSLQPTREAIDITCTVGFHIFTSSLRIAARIARPVEDFVLEDVVKLLGALVAEFFIAHGFGYGASEPSCLFGESIG